MKQLDLLKGDSIEYVEKLISEWQVKIENKNVQIKITLDSNGYYQFSTSHYYKSSNLAGTTISSLANLKTEEEALFAAKKQISGMYDPEDKNAKWIINTSF